MLRSDKPAAKAEMFDLVLSMLFQYVIWCQMLALSTNCSLSDIPLPLALTEPETACVDSRQCELIQASPSTGSRRADSLWI